MYLFGSATEDLCQRWKFKMGIIQRLENFESVALKKNQIVIKREGFWS